MQNNGNRAFVWLLIGAGTYFWLDRYVFERRLSRARKAEAFRAHERGRVMKKRKRSDANNG